MAPGGRGRLNQPRLTFRMNTPRPNLRRNDTVEGAGAEIHDFSSSTHSVGQVADRGLNSRQEVVDEK